MGKYTEEYWMRDPHAVQKRRHLRGIFRRIETNTASTHDLNYILDNCMDDYELVNKVVNYRDVTGDMLVKVYCNYVGIYMRPLRNKIATMKRLPSEFKFQLSLEQ